MIDYNKKFRLDGKTAVVAGGLGLIGKEVSIALAQVGAKTVVLDIDKKKGKDFEKEAKKQKLDINFKEFDITNFKTYEETLKQIEKDYGKIQIWINTAYPRTKDWANRLEDIKSGSWQENVDMHMNSYCLLTRDVAENMKQKKVKGSIINLSSIYGVVSPDFEVYAGTEMTNPAAYSAIKGGITNFSRYAASYYGKCGIRVNAVCPGGVFDKQNPVFVENYNRRTLLKRMATAEEIAATILFLASDASSYITGAAIMVDGGWTSI